MGVDVVLLGHLTRDMIILKGKKRSSIGGAVYYSAFPLRKMGLEVAVMTKIADKDFSLLKDFKKEKIDLYCFQSRETSCFELVYKENSDKRKIKSISLADSFKPKDIPDLEAKIFHIGALVKGEVPLEVIKKISEKHKISLDAQGFIRYLDNNELKFGNWKEKEESLAYVHTLKVDSVEAEILTKEINLTKAVKKLYHYGPKEIVLTSEKGVMVYDGNYIYEAPFKSRKIKGRTGRGDTCIAAYLGMRLKHAPAEACRFAAALTSLKMEKLGPFKGHIKTVEKFLKKYY